MQFKTVKEIETTILPIADEMAIEIVDIVYDSKANALTVFIETADGVDHLKTSVILKEILKKKWKSGYTLRLKATN